MALAVDGEVYDTIVADIQRAVSAEIETAIAPWREEKRIALERVEELEGALHKYGEHLDDCKILNEDPQPCSCGLLNALDGGSDERG